MSETESLRSFVVVLRAPAAARLREHEVLPIKGVGTAYGSVDLQFRTRYDESGLDANIPRELWIDARGQAPSVNGAIDAFAAAASIFTPMLSVATNAAILERQVHIAYDNTRGVAEREFFQAFVPDERGLPRIGRWVNAGVSREFFASVSRSGDHERLVRACAQYQQALSYWGHGQELLALAHLYMGVEALTKASLRWVLERDKTTEEQLARRWSVENKKGAIESAIRRKVIFQGDLDCYKEAKDASDGLEHGYLGFGELHKMATRRRDQTAKYLREAIIDCARCDDLFREELRKNETPVGAWRLVRYFRGWLVGEGDELAAEGQSYPIMRWESSIKSARLDADGNLNVDPDEKLTPRLAEGISLKPGSYEVWGPSSGRTEGKRLKADLKVKLPGKQDSKRERVVGFLERVNRLVSDYGTGEMFEAKFTDAVLLAIFAECRSQFRAIAILVGKGLPNEAMAVVTGLQRHALRLRHLADAEERLPYVLGWLREDIVLKRQMKETAPSEALEAEFLQPLKSTALEEGKLDAYAASKAVPVTTFPGDDELVNRSSELMRLGWMMGKQVALGYGPSYDAPVKDGIGFDTTCGDASYLGFVGCVAVESILLACRAAAAIFGWPEVDQEDSLLKTAYSLTVADSPKQAPLNSPPT